MTSALRTKNLGIGCHDNCQMDHTDEPLPRQRRKQPATSQPQTKNAHQNKKKNSTITRNSGHQRKSLAEALVSVGTFFAVVAVVLGLVYRRYGITIFVGYESFDLRHSAKEWKRLLEGKTILLIGGPHRGGTSILWEALSRHPDISGFGSSFETGRDHSEGILMQNVYPDLGVGTEGLMTHHRRGQNMPQGVGRYALANETHVHLIETNRRVTEKNFAKLLNRFGPYWDLSKPVLMEKSPPTAVMSRFLQALYNVPVDGAETTGPSTKFLFITRHPLANVYAQQAFLGTVTVSVTTLMENYIQMHKYMLADMLKLRNEPKLIKLEEFAQSPKEALAGLHQWLGLRDASAESMNGGLKIQSDPNAKYKGSVDCSETFQQIVKTKYQPELDAMGLDYNILEWCN
jgi:Sulfotransferase family